MRVAILAFDACFGAELFGIADLLQMANRVSAHVVGNGPPPFEVSIVGVAGRAVVAAGGVRVAVRRLGRSVDLLVVPGFEFIDPGDLAERLRARRGEVALIRRLFARGVPVASICVGAFLLGEAGLLHTRRATTAWAFAPALARRYPTVRVQADAVVVEDGGVTTSAAFSAALDLGMTLVERHTEPRVAKATAKLTLLASARASQAPYVDASLLAPTGPSSIAAPFSDAVKAYLLRRLGQPYDLPRLAKAFHVSTRTLLRRFRAEVRQSPLEFVQAERVARAKHLLESTALTVGDVMAEIGYGDLSTFRRLFLSRVGISPAAYRRQFRRPSLYAARRRRGRPLR